MASPEVWIAAAATPSPRSAAVTRLTASLALASADPTDAPFTWTPMLSSSWFGVPVTVPVPATVIRPELTAAARFAGWVPPGAGPADDDPEPPLPQPPTATAPPATSATRHVVTSPRRAGKL